ncbi:hypothetical protein YB2330_005139 [Saitoella coloradoensis]
MSTYLQGTVASAASSILYERYLELEGVSASSGPSRSGSGSGSGSSSSGGSSHGGEGSDQSRPRSPPFLSSGDQHYPQHYGEQHHQQGHQGHYTMTAPTHMYTHSSSSISPHLTYHAHPSQPPPSMAHAQKRKLSTNGILTTHPTLPQKSTRIHAPPKLDQHPTWNPPLQREASSSTTTEEIGVEGLREWPAGMHSIGSARGFLLRAAKAASALPSSSSRILLVPDRDADGLSSGQIIKRTLLLLGAHPDNIYTHFVDKSRSVHDPVERAAMEGYGARYVVVMDQGSRGGPPLVAPTSGAGESVEVLVIDHHYSEDFPEGAMVVSACQHPPIATTSMLAYILCTPLHRSVADLVGWFAILGTYGDLGSSIKFNGKPWPEELAPLLKEYTKKRFTESVSLVNAPRRLDGNPLLAWEALDHPDASPVSVVESQALRRAKEATKAEIERCQRPAPKFSRDGRVAVVEVKSFAQVHPVIASRWSSTLSKGSKGGRGRCEMVCVANIGYIPSRVNFSCRPVGAARLTTDEGAEGDVDLIKMLEEYACSKEGFRSRVGADFARGHRRATGGSLVVELWEEFRDEILEVGVKNPEELSVKELKEAKEQKGQKRLDQFFVKKE